MSAMIHAVIAKDEGGTILQVISCFSEQQVPIAKKNILREFPKAKITIKQTPHEHHE